MPVICFGLPLLAVILINSTGHATVTIGMITFPRLSAYAGGEFQLTGFWRSFCSFFGCILGNDQLVYNAFPRYYTFYGISIPFALYGVYLLYQKGIAALRHRRFSMDTLVMLLMLTGMVFFPVVKDVNINKSNGIFFALFYCLILGIEYVIKHCQLLFGGRRTVKCTALLTLFYGICAFSFCRYYFLQYPDKLYPQDYFAGEYGALLDYMEENIEKPKEVYLLDSSYIYYLVSSQESPYVYDMSREDREKQYLSFHFNAPYPENVDPENSVYIVRETYGDAIEELEKYDYNYYEYGMYRLYY